MSEQLKAINKSITICRNLRFISTMGMIIPPSVPMIIYALVSEESVGKLFLGSLIPGVMIGFLMLGITLTISYWKKFPREEVVMTGKEKIGRVKIRVQRARLWSTPER